MKFTVHGPFRVPKTQSGIIDSSPRARREFWQAANLDEKLSLACGCYVFAIRAGKGMKPWYVGLTHRQSFERECFTPHKYKIYNDSVAGRIGNPMLFLLARRTTRGALAKPSRREPKELVLVEGLLIGYAVQRNPGFKNVARTRVLRELSLPGLINSPRGNPGAAALSLKRTFFKK
jgi:hypothetical protein